MRAGGDHHQIGAGEKPFEGVERGELAAESRRANAPHRLGKQRDLDAALARGELERFGRLAGRDVEGPLPRCRGGTSDGGQAGEKETKATELLEDEDKRP